MLGDELVLGGLPLSNLTALADTLAAGLRPLGVFITTNEGFRWGTPCNATMPCTAPSGAGPQTCAPVEADAPTNLSGWPKPGALVAMGEYVINCRFQSNRARRYIRLHMS
jgi:hypothetical protein